MLNSDDPSTRSNASAVLPPPATPTPGRWSWRERLGLAAAKRGPVRFQGSPQHDGRQFRNATAKPGQSIGKTLKILWSALFHKPQGTVPAAPLPVDQLTRAQLEAAPNHTAYRLGHSTLLFKLQDAFWITDPVFGERASPFKHLGPKRFHAPPIALEELPPLAGAILSHDHYDHLDRETVLALNAKTEVFLTPLGVGDRLMAWGVPADKVHQLDWWQTLKSGGLHFTATPAQHFSGRSLFDSNSTLWCSWVIQEANLRIFFSGDSGYFDGFKSIGERLGPFDVAFMETGAYDPQWPYVHMHPSQTVQAFEDLRGRHLVPIHNGTFDLAMHAWEDPFERVTRLARKRSLQVCTPRIGEPIALDHPQPGSPWWESVRNDKKADKEVQ